MSALEGNPVATWPPPGSWRPTQGTVDVGSDAVARIVDYAEEAVDAIAAHAERQIAELAGEVESRSVDAGHWRRQRLFAVRQELAERARALATAQAEVATLLEALDGQLAASADPRRVPAPPSEVADPRLEAIRLTLRERQRIEVPAPEAQAVEYQEAVVTELRPADRERRRWWRPWQRAA